MIAADLATHDPSSDTTWHLDEVASESCSSYGPHLWRAVDAEGEVLDWALAKEQEEQAVPALKLDAQAAEEAAGFPRPKLVTDDLRSPAAAAESDLAETRRHERGRWRNDLVSPTRINRPDDEPTRAGTRAVRAAVWRLPSTDAANCNTFYVERHHTSERTGPSLSRSLGDEHVARGGRGRFKKRSGLGIIVLFFQRCDNVLCADDDSHKGDPT